MEAGSSLFSEEFRQQLTYGKYTKWAVNLTEAQLGGMLWMIGEFGYRSWLLSTRLLMDAEWGRFRGYPRARLALESISRIVLRGERFDMEEASARIRRGRGHLKFFDLPETVQTAAHAASPKTRRDSVMQSVDGFELEGLDAKGRTVGFSITDQGEVFEKTALEEDTVLGWPGAGRKTVATLVESPPFEGPMRIRLIEERSGDSIRHVLACRKNPPLTASELILFTAPLPPEGYILKSPVAWEREVPEQEAREILNILEEARPPLASEDERGWLDGIGYEFRMRRASFTIRMQWQVRVPRGWEFLEILAKTVRRRAEVESTIRKLTKGERARVALKLREQYEAAALIRKREEAEELARQNQKIRRLFESQSASGMACPHCGRHSTGFRFFEVSPGGKSHLVCPECGRSIWGDDPRLPAA